MLCSPLGPSSWKPWPSLGLHRARPADQRFNLHHPSFPTQAPKTQNENWWSHLAHLLCEVFTRLRAVGLAQDHACSLPLTQMELGDACGLSSVHVNRTLQELRGEGLIEFRSSRLTILDWARLHEVAQ